MIERVLRAGALALALGTAANAANLVQNGGFETTTLPSPGGNATAYVPNWSVAFGVTLWFPGTGDVLPNASAMWGPNDGSANGLPATSPAGGNYLEQDANFVTASFGQTITGLTPNARYKLGFWWAAAQWYYAAGVPTTNQWFASLGAQTQQTAIVTVPYAGFHPWKHESFIYTPSNATEILSFISLGSGDPPLALLDGVTLTAVPDMDTWVLLVLGFGVLGLAGRMQRGQQTSS